MTKISRGVEISIAGGGEEMVHALLPRVTSPLFICDLHSSTLTLITHSY